MGVINAAAFLQNEIMGWPPLVIIGTGFDLVTQNQWWDDEGSPTTKGTAVPTSGEAGLDAKFTEVIKWVSDAANEGVLQTYTYADQPRIKSGVHLSALVWCATTTGGTGFTVKLRNSDATATSATVIATDGDWSLYKVEDHTCAGTSVALVITLDAASGTGYCFPVSVMLGTDAVGLPPRRYKDRWLETPVQIHDYGAATVTVAYADEDVTTSTSALATHALCTSYMAGNTGAWNIHARRNGSADAFSVGSRKATCSLSSTAERTYTVWDILLDDVQIFEHGLEEESAGTLGAGQVWLIGYREWE